MDPDICICGLTLLTVSRHAWSLRSQAARLSPAFHQLGARGEDEESSLGPGRLPLVATGLIYGVLGLLVCSECCKAGGNCDKRQQSASRLVVYRALWVVLPAEFVLLPWPSSNMHDHVMPYRNECSKVLRTVVTSFFLRLHSGHTVQHLLVRI
jgi:hypothetical protein